MGEIYTNFRWGLTGETQELETKDGRVVYRGALRGSTGTDLSGRVLWPSYVDNHCHILPTGLDLLKLQLGPCQTREEVLDAVRGRLSQIESGAWLMAVHYDQTKFSDGRHIERHELDAISSTVPILLRHVSGHASVANSAALKAAGVDKSTPDPTGGTFERDAAGELTGVLLETAHERVTAASPNLTVEQMSEAILLAANEMAKFGITCASDMMTGRFGLESELKAYEVASRMSPVRFRLYVQYANLFGPRAMQSDLFNELTQSFDTSKLAIAGAKIFADGAIGSCTAAIYGKYATQMNGPDDQGTLIYAPDKFKEMVRKVHESGMQVAIHSIGDRSTDLVMDAFEAVGDASRHRIEHAMIMSDDQIERMARIGCHVTMQPEFLTRFAHAYRRNLGPERASMLKRFRSVKDAGLRLSFGSDRPIVLGDPAIGVECASNRPEGYDPRENLSREEAMLAYTKRAAESNGDSDMGSLNPGDLADFRLEN